MELSEIHFSEEEKRRMLEEEKLAIKKSDFCALIQFGMIPGKVSFEQWIKRGCPLDWKE